MMALTHLYASARKRISKDANPWWCVLSRGEKGEKKVSGR